MNANHCGLQSCRPASPAAYIYGQGIRTAARDRGPRPQDGRGSWVRAETSGLCSSATLMGKRLAKLMGKRLARLRFSPFSHQGLLFLTEPGARLSLKGLRRRGALSEMDEAEPPEPTREPLLPMLSG